MVDTVHRNLTGADLHEPKGVDTALTGQVYVSDGAGSGAWETASSVITNTAWSTGDVKLTHKFTADDGWIMWSDQTIGDASSGATARANADCAALFTLYWGYSNTYCPVSGGRGVSAAADFAAHKTIGIPKSAGRVLGIAGSGSGLTTRAPGSTVGEENHTLTTAEMPQHSHTATTTNSSSTFALSFSPSYWGVIDTTAVTNYGSGSNVGTYSSGFNTSTPTATIPALALTLATSVGYTGSSDPHNTMQPTSFLNAMIKL